MKASAREAVQVPGKLGGSPDPTGGHCQASASLGAAACRDEAQEDPALQGPVEYARSLLPFPLAQDERAY